MLYRLNDDSRVAAVEEGGLLEDGDGLLLAADGEEPARRLGEDPDVAEVEGGDERQSELELPPVPQEEGKARHEAVSQAERDLVQDRNCRPPFSAYHFHTWIKRLIKSELELLPRSLYIGLIGPHLPVGNYNF